MVLVVMLVWLVFWGILGAALGVKLWRRGYYALPTLMLGMYVLIVYSFFG
jgi:uncharacterized membrane protein